MVDNNKKKKPRVKIPSNTRRLLMSQKQLKKITRKLQLKKFMT